jgi:hypothetical protein
VLTSEFYNRCQTPSLLAESPAVFSTCQKCRGGCPWYAWFAKATIFNDQQRFKHGTFSHTTDRSAVVPKRINLSLLNCRREGSRNHLAITIYDHEEVGLIRWGTSKVFSFDTSNTKRDLKRERMLIKKLPRLEHVDKPFEPSVFSIQIRSGFNHGF